MLDEDFYGATYEYRPGKTYPIELVNEGQTEERLIYDLEEAEALLASLEAAVELAREALITYVQVSFDRGSNSAGSRYTYIDPTGTLKVGDRVEVMSYDFQPSIVTVVALGRGTWDGPCKPVTAKLTREEL